MLLTYNTRTNEKKEHQFNLYITRKIERYVGLVYSNVRTSLNKSWYGPTPTYILMISSSLPEWDLVSGFVRPNYFLLTLAPLLT